jgi:hypothetical protein
MALTIYFVKYQRRKECVFGWGNWRQFLLEKGVDDSGTRMMFIEQAKEFFRSKELNRLEETPSGRNRRSD